MKRDGPTAAHASAGASLARGEFGSDAKNGKYFERERFDLAGRTEVRCEWGSQAEIDGAQIHQAGGKGICSVSEIEVRVRRVRRLHENRRVDVPAAIVIGRQIPV